MFRRTHVNLTDEERKIASINDEFSEWFKLGEQFTNANNLIEIIDFVSSRI